MSVIYVVFKNRTTTLMFYEALKRIKIHSKVVSTPKKIISSCGLSVELGLENFKIVIQLLKTGKYSGLVGVYKNKFNETFYEKMV